MKKTVKTLMIGLLAATASGTIASCGKTNTLDTALHIVYYPGGYGTEWMETFLKEFLSEEYDLPQDEIKAGVHYKLEPDTNITYGAETKLRSKKACPDIIMATALPSQFISATDSKTHQPLIAELSDVYDTEIDTHLGKMKIRDFIEESSFAQFNRQRLYGQGEAKPFAIPQTSIPIAMAYNETLLKSINHVSTTYTLEPGAINATTGKWDRAPITMDELFSYFEDVDNYNAENNKNIVKFGWAGGDGSNWFESLLLTWWAQSQGLYDSNYEGQGSYYDFWSYSSPEIFKQTGLQDSLAVAKKLVTKDGDWTNSPKGVMSYDIKACQTAFANGEIAVCLTGDFFEHEYADVLSTNSDTFKMMRVPAIDKAPRDNDGNILKYTEVNQANVMYLPSGAKNLDLAKKFLIYTCQEQQCIRFTQMTGGIRPFKYNVLEQCPDYEFTEFQKSVFDLYYNNDELLIKYPKKDNLEDISPIYIYENVKDSLFVGSDYLSVLSMLRTLTPQQIMVDGGPNFQSIYSRAQKAFEEWQMNYQIYF